MKIFNENSILVLLLKSLWQMINDEGPSNIICNENPKTAIGLWSIIRKTYTFSTTHSIFRIYMKTIEILLLKQKRLHDLLP